MGRVRLASLFVLAFFALLGICFSASSQPHAQCSGQSSILVPAVMGNSGGLVEISVKIMPGNGSAFITTNPRTGVSTQESVDNAISCIASEYGVPESDCDVLISIDSMDAPGFVDGPSAGAAFAAAIYSASSGQPLRQDAIVSGEVDQYCNVLPVGGLYEKAMAAIAGGNKYFITPINSISDRMMLVSLRKTYNVSVLEAYNASQLVEFMALGKEIPPVMIKADGRSLPNLTAYDASGLGDFSKIALDIIHIENLTISSLPETSAEESEIKEYFSGEVKKQLELFEKGYVFTAANDAFLNYIDVGTMVMASSDQLDPSEKISAINSCFTRLTVLQKTSGSFEYIIGSELRELWAKHKVSGVQGEAPGLQEEKYQVFNELMYADAWCRIASSLHDVDLAGEPVNESAWKGYASSKLAEADAIGAQSEDIREKIANAHELFESGKYGASIFESTFAITMDDVDLETSGAPGNAEISSSISNKVSVLASQERDSLWGKVYQGQGVFLSQSGPEQGRSAYRILRFAVAIDNATAEMRRISGIAGDGTLEPQLLIIGGTNSSQVLYSGRQTEEDLLSNIYTITAILILLAWVVLKIFPSKSNSGSNQAKSGLPERRAHKKASRWQKR